MKYLVVIASVVFAAPALAFGDPAEAGAAAWCGARARGASKEEADDQLRSSMAAQLSMSTSFAGAIVGILGNRKGIQSQIDYHISKNCPQFLGRESSNNQEVSGSSEATASQWDEEMCSKYPEVGKNYCNKKEKTVQTPIPIENKPKTTDATKKAENNTSEKKLRSSSTHKMCLKASDYAGCMRYNTKE